MFDDPLDVTFINALLCNIYDLYVYTGKGHKHWENLLLGIDYCSLFMYLYRHKKDYINNPDYDYDFMYEYLLYKIESAYYYVKKEIFLNGLD